MSNHYEIVYTCPGFYDGPRDGIADLGGLPHLFKSEWNDGQDLDSDTFLLMPIDSELFAQALESWSIWLRWESAYKAGKVAPETHPTLLEDRERYDELNFLLEDRLTVDPTRAERKTAQFRAGATNEWSGHMPGPLEVCWEDVPNSR